MTQTSSLTSLVLVQVELKETDYKFKLESLERLVLDECTSHGNALVHLIAICSNSLQELVMEFDPYDHRDQESRPSFEFDFKQLNCYLPELRKLTIKDYSQWYYVSKVSGASPGNQDSSKCFGFGLVPSARTNGIASSTYLL